MTKLTKTLMKTLTRITAFGLMALSGVYFLRINSPYGLRMNSASRMGLFLPKILAGSLAPFLVLAGTVSGLLAFLLRLPVTGAIASLATFLAGRYTRRATAPHDGFNRAFGPGWEQKIPPDVAARLPAPSYETASPSLVPTLLIPPCGCSRGTSPVPRAPVKMGVSRGGSIR